MKKLFILFAMTAMFVACGPKTTTEEQTAVDTTVVFEDTAVVVEEAVEVVDEPVEVVEFVDVEPTE